MPPNLFLVPAQSAIFQCNPYNWSRGTRWTSNDSVTTQCGELLYNLFNTLTVSDRYWTGIVKVFNLVSVLIYIYIFMGFFHQSSLVTEMKNPCQILKSFWSPILNPQHLPLLSYFHISYYQKFPPTTRPNTIILLAHFPMLTLSQESSSFMQTKWVNDLCCSFISRVLSALIVVVPFGSLQPNQRPGPPGLNWQIWMQFRWAGVALTV